MGMRLKAVYFYAVSLSSSVGCLGCSATAQTTLELYRITDGVTHAQSGLKGWEAA